MRGGDGMMCTVGCVSVLYIVCGVLGGHIYSFCICCIVLCIYNIRLDHLRLALGVTYMYWGSVECHK